MLSRSCRGHDGEVTDLAINMQSSMVASSSNDQTIRCWSLEVSLSVFTDLWPSPLLCYTVALQKLTCTAIILGEACTGANLSHAASWLMSKSCCPLAHIQTHVGQDIFSSLYLSCRQHYLSMKSLCASHSAKLLLSRICAKSRRGYLVEHIAVHCITICLQYTCCCFPCFDICL